MYKCIKMLVAWYAAALAYFIILPNIKNPSAEIQQVYIKNGETVFIINRTHIGKYIKILSFWAKSWKYWYWESNLFEC